MNAVLSLESTMDELSFVLGPALIGVASVLAHPAYAFAGAAVLVAVCGTAFALHPTAAAVPAPRRAARSPSGRGCPARSTSCAWASCFSASCSVAAAPESPRSRRSWATRTRPGSSTPRWAS
ncbi:hypothetical protein V2W30_30945 [Streptomyces sp. Q6]|uniref:Uncharacterized protein n=1 Tax=Streptomyces citrinus TaxID=3118173 RepID=A0ACD5AJG2_9ACTN